jgi:hypothetical protein
VALGDEHALASNPALWSRRSPLEDWRVLAPGDAVDGVPDAGADGAGTRVRMSLALAEGRVAVVPPPQAGGGAGEAWQPGCWWRIDPATGTTLGIGPRGWGQEFPEFGAISKIGQGLILAAKQLGASIVCFAAAVTARYYVFMLINGIAEVVEASTETTVVLHCLSQSGYSGAVFTYIENVCKAFLVP